MRRGLYADVTLGKPKHVACPQCGADLSAHYAAMLKVKELDAAVNPEADPVELTPACPTEEQFESRMYAPVLRRE